jgi:hypothetical protein
MMKIDASIPYLGSLLVLTYCSIALVGAALFGKLSALLHSASFPTIVVSALLTLLMAYRALGKPMSEAERIACEEQL